jgi:hypothetical protein
VAEHLLKACGASASKKNVDGLTPLMCAVQQGHLLLIQVPSLRLTRVVPFLKQAPRSRPPSPRPRLTHRAARNADACVRLRPLCPRADPRAGSRACARAGGRARGRAARHVDPPAPPPTGERAAGALPAEPPQPPSALSHAPSISAGAGAGSAGAAGATATAAARRRRRRRRRQMLVSHDGDSLDYTNNSVQPPPLPHSRRRPYPPPEAP